MSDTPPDQKDPDDAAAAPRNPWVGWLVWAILAPVLYVLSVGPMCWLAHEEYVPKEIYLIYRPLSLLPYETFNLIADYERLFVELRMNSIL